MKNLKRKGLMAAALAGVFAASTLLTSCSSVNRESYVDDEGETIYTYYFNMYTQDNTEYKEGQDTVFANLLRDKFHVEFEYERIPRGDWETKTNLAYATGNEADVTTGGKEPQYKKWANEGYLEAIPEEYYTGDDAILKDWANLWTPDEFERVLELAKSPDGQLYYLPSKRQEKVQMCWVYRQDVFEELGLEFPQTIDELYDVCMKIKAAYPDKIIISSNGQTLSSLTGFFQAYWIPELVMTEHSYVDPVTGEYIPYALTTDNAREMYKTIKKFSDAGLIDREILTMDKDMFSSRLAQDNCFITYNYVYNTDDFTKKTNATNPNKGGVWAWSGDMITAFPEKGTIYKRDPLYSNWGPAFSAGISDNKDRYEALLKTFNWFATEEGQMFMTYGIEGDSFEYDENGVPHILDGWYDESDPNSDKDTEKNFSTEYGSFSSQFVKEENMFNAIRGDVIEDLWDAYQAHDNYYYFEQIPMRYTEDEQTRFSDLEVALNAKRNEYLQRFFAGDVDPNNDADWNQYISDMKKVGLDDFCELQTTVYERTQEQIAAEENDNSQADATDTAAAE